MTITFTPIHLPTNSAPGPSKDNITFTPISLDKSTENPSMLHDLANKADYINAFGGGVAKAGAGIIEGAADLMPYTLQQLHVISPETSAKLQAQMTKDTNLLRPSDQSISGKAMQQHPILAKTGEYGTDTYGLVEGMGLANGIGEAATALAPGIPKVAGVLGRMAGMGLVNKAAGGNFTTGAALSPVMDLGGYMLGKLGSQSAAKAALTNEVNSYTKSAVNKAYDVIKNIPFTNVDKESLNTISSGIDDLLKNTNPARFIGSQAKTLANYRDQLANANSFDDTLTILKNLGSDSKKLFAGSKVFPDLYKSVQGVRSDIEHVINQAAIKNGVNDALATASNLAQKTRIVNKTFEGMNENADFSFKTASTKLGKLIDKYGDSPYMSDTVNTLKGLKKLTDTASKAVKLPTGVLNLIGGTTGAYAGYQHDGVAGAVVGGAGGALGTYGLIQGAQKLISTPAGQKFLASLAKPGWTMDEINHVVKAVTLTGINKSQGLYDTYGKSLYDNYIKNPGTSDNSTTYNSSNTNQ
jgi:hypothetical protein